MMISRDFRCGFLAGGKLVLETLSYSRTRCSPALRGVSTRHSLVYQPQKANRQNYPNAYGTLGRDVVVDVERGLRRCE